MFDLPLKPLMKPMSEQLDYIAAEPPIAARKPSQTTIHGVTLHDDYAWLRDANWREAMHDPDKLDADIRAYLEAENAYTDAMMADTSGELRQALVAEMRARMVEADASVPTPDGDWVYYVRFREGGQHPIFCRAPRRSRRLGRRRASRWPANRSCWTATPKPRAGLIFQPRRGRS